MKWLRWLTRNWADTDQAGDITLTPPELKLPAAEAICHLQKVIGGLARWHVETSDVTARSIHATRRTRWWGFVDDVWLRLEPTGGGVRVHARSQSRLGKADFGQNRRNLLELFAALRRAG
jgi:uncharacterized protein (DUF1499 family)